MPKTCWEKRFGNIGDEDRIRRFAGSIGDWNPLHHSDAAAKKAGLLGIIAPGIMITGFASSAIAEEIPGVKVRRLEVEFLNPLYAGSSLLVLCTVLKQKKQLAQVAITIKNGFEIIAKGSCLLFLPQEPA